MMTTIFVVCYAVLSFATAVMMYAYYHRFGVGIEDAEFKIALFFWAVLWPLFWAIFAIGLFFFSTWHGIKKLGLKVSKYL